MARRVMVWSGQWALLLLGALLRGLQARAFDPLSVVCGMLKALMTPVM